MQYFKGDPVEKKFVVSSSQVFLGIFAELQKFFDDAYNCYKLGEALYDENTTVLTRAVARDVFARSFNQIIEKWQFVGSFESYLFVFKAIFGDDSIITFERTAPAYLTINIQATSTELFNFLARTITEIEGEEIVEDDDVLTADGLDELAFGLQLGITDFYEVQSILNSLNPAGIYLEVNFSLF